MIPPAVCLPSPADLSRASLFGLPSYIQSLILSRSPIAREFASHR